MEAGRFAREGSANEGFANESSANEQEAHECFARQLSAQDPSVTETPGGEPVWNEQFGFKGVR
jgi:hypothetical protein